MFALRTKDTGGGSLSKGLGRLRSKAAGAGCRWGPLGTSPAPPLLRHPVPKAVIRQRGPGTGPNGPSCLQACVCVEGAGAHLPFPTQATSSQRRLWLRTPHCHCSLLREGASFIPQDFQCHQPWEALPASLSQAALAWTTLTGCLQPPLRNTTRGLRPGASGWPVLRTTGLWHAPPPRALWPSVCLPGPAELVAPKGEIHACPAQH